jgi:hypothetical protein
VKEGNGKQPIKLLRVRMGLQQLERGKQVSYGARRCQPGGHAWTWGWLAPSNSHYHERWIGHLLADWGVSGHGWTFSIRNQGTEWALLMREHRRPRGNFRPYAVFRAKAVHVEPRLCRSNSPCIAGAQRGFLNASNAERLTR